MKLVAIELSIFNGLEQRSFIDPQHSPLLPFSQRFRKLVQPDRSDVLQIQNNPKDRARDSRQNLETDVYLLRKIDATEFASVLEFFQSSIRIDRSSWRFQHENK